MEHHKYGYCPRDVFLAQGHFKRVGLRWQTGALETRAGGQKKRYYRAGQDYFSILFVPSYFGLCCCLCLECPSSPAYPPIHLPTPNLVFFVKFFLNLKTRFSDHC